MAFSLANLATLLVHTCALTSSLQPQLCLAFLLNLAVRKMMFKCKSHHITPLVKTLQWFTISVSIKAKFLPMAWKTFGNVLSLYFRLIFHHFLLFSYVPDTLSSSLFLVPVCHWVNYLSSQSLSFLIYKMDIKIVRTSEDSS